MADLMMVVGAATPPGRLAAAIAFAAESARAEGASVDVLNLAETVLDICDGKPDDDYGAATRDAIGRMIAAKAVLFGAPVYRASYPGVLKNLLDLAPVKALQAKPVGILAMGGSPHHYLGVESQMKDVLQWFGAMVAPTNCYVTGSDFKDGQLASEGARKDLAALTKTLIMLSKLDPASLGPIPLAAKYT
jgi:FMN reductase